MFHSTRKRRGGEEGSCGRLRTVVAHGSKKAEEGTPHTFYQFNCQIWFSFSPRLPSYLNDLGRAEADRRSP